LGGGLPSGGRIFNQTAALRCLGDAMSPGSRSKKFSAEVVPLKDRRDV
jgi:hypothetical protein